MRSEKPAHERTHVLSLQPFFFALKQSFQGAIMINTAISHVHFAELSAKASSREWFQVICELRVANMANIWQAHGKNHQPCQLRVSTSPRAHHLGLPQRKLGGDTHRPHWTFLPHHHHAQQPNHSLIVHSTISIIHSHVHNTAKPTVSQYLVP